MIRSRLANGANASAFSATETATVASSASTSTFSFGPIAPSCSPFRRAPFPRSAVHSSPRPEVVDEAEDDVLHRRALGDGDRDREVRDVPLRVQRAVDRVDDHAELRVDAERPLAELLGHEMEVHALLLVKGLEARHDRSLGGRVHGGRLVSAHAVADHRLPLDPRRHRGEDLAQVADGRAT